MKVWRDYKVWRIIKFYEVWRIWQINAISPNFICQHFISVMAFKEIRQTLLVQIDF